MKSDLYLTDVIFRNYIHHENCTTNDNNIVVNITFGTQRIIVDGAVYSHIYHY